MLNNKQDIKPYENKELERIKITDDLKGSKIIKKTKIPSTGIQKIILESQLCMLISKNIYNPKKNLNSAKERIVCALLNVIKSSKKIKCYKNVKKYFK